MKKSILTLILMATVLSASWLPFNKQESQKEEIKMLQATPFSQIKPLIGKAPLMIEFGSIGCYSCQEMGKILYKIKQKYPKANIYFLDINQDMPTAKKFGIRIIPTQKYLDKNGSIVDTHMGIINQDELEQKLKKLEIIKE